MRYSISNCVEWYQSDPAWLVIGSCDGARWDTIPRGGTSRVNHTPYSDASHQAGRKKRRMTKLTRRDFGRVASSTALGGLAAAGISLAPAAARAQQLRISDAKATPSICPFCAVGCATLIHTVEGRVVNIEGDARSPHSEGTLCPKGAAIFQLHVNPNRPTQVLHRAPGAADWEVWDLERAMARVAELTKKTRDETFMERLADGTQVNCTTSIFALGGATLDNEWNHIQQKLMRGLGIVPIENQARI
jgi:formate dehydrogenase major subunit